MPGGRRLASELVARRKLALRDRLISIAERRISEDGVASLRARDLAREAECSVGAIYNVFDDLNALVMTVNGRTFQKLGDDVSAAVRDAGEIAPRERLIVMSQAYLAFASGHTGLWRALFDLDMRADGPVPDWYLRELAGLFALIAEPVGALFPDQSAAERDLMVRALFSSVHGIVLLGLQRRISAVPLDQIETMIAAVLSQIGEA